MLRLHPSTIDYVILAIYFVVVLGIGFVARLCDQDRPRLLPLRPLAAGVDHRPGVHRRQPRRARDPRPGGQRRPVRRPGGPLLLDRRGPGDDLPGAVHDALLLRRQGPLGARVPAAALQRGDPRVQRRDVRRRDGADLRRQPVRARADHPPDARLVDHVRDPRRRRAGARLHHARRPDLGDLQRGAAVLRDRRRAAAADARRAAFGRRHQRARAQGQGVQAARRRRPARLAGSRHPPRHQPARVGLGRRRVRARVRAQLRLLDDELRRGAARPVGAQHVGGAAHAADRRLPEDLPAGDHHPPGPDRRADGARPRREQGHQPPVQHGDPAPDRQLPARGDARARDHRPARGVHGRRGGQRDLVQHGRHLRPHPVVLRQGPRRRRTTCGRAGS